MSETSEVDQPWSRSAESVRDAMDVDLDEGLDESTVKQRIERFGQNILRETGTTSWWTILLHQFGNLIIILLLTAAVVAFLFGEWLEGWAILAVIVINSLIGFFTELRAVRSMESLRELGGVTARVKRDGSVQEIPAEELVPGDVVELEGGDIVTADIRLTEASKLQVDESPLTGESVPVEKGAAPVDEETPLAERTSMLYKGTAVTRGSGKGIVVSTGMETELGEISDLVATAEQEQTPLEDRLDALGHKLIWVTLLIAAFVTASGVAAGKELFLMVETGIALAVAAIPEGLPIVATMALARGMWQMARKNALINRLSAVETLGSTTVIFTDKTGTLTENEMTVRRYRLADQEINVDRDADRAVLFLLNGDDVDPTEHDGLKRALEVGSLCNNATISEEEGGVGDPMEVALLEVAQQAGIRREKLLESRPEVKEDAFDTDTKMMATYHETEDDLFVAVKGAPERVIDHAETIHTPEGTDDFDRDRKDRWIERNRALAEDGLRMLGLAYRHAEAEDDPPYDQLTFLGLVALLDPPRSDVREAIDRCKEAGIQVIMVTGDQAETAQNISYEVGLSDAPDTPVVSGSELEELEENEQGQKQITGTDIFSRVSPAQKLGLIETYQQRGEIVAMTGDGVNDAPALKKADIGVAMGQRGTQVAKEAADMVLKDDAFSTIVSAVERGRVIFKNIRKFVFYLLSCNVSEILVVGLASGLRMPLPILPLQILFLNLVTDVFPALALGMGEGDPHTMKHPPRDPEEPIIQWNHWLAMGTFGLVFTGSVLGSLAMAIHVFNFDVGRAVSVSFLTLASAQLWHVFNMRDFGSGVLNNDIVKNGYVWGALGLCVVLLLLAVYLPGLSHVLKVSDPGLNGWLMVLGFSFIPLLFGQVIKLFKIRLNH